MEPAPAVIDLCTMFPDVEHHGIRYVLRVCGLRDIPSQTKLIEFEDIETLEDLENYTDSEFDLISDRNFNRTPMMCMFRWI